MRAALVTVLIGGLFAGTFFFPETPKKAEVKIFRVKEEIPKPVVAKPEERAEEKIVPDSEETERLRAKQSESAVVSMSNEIENKMIEEKNRIQTQLAKRRAMEEKFQKQLARYLASVKSRESYKPVCGAYSLQQKPHTGPGKRRK